MADADRSVNMARRAFFLVLFSTCATSTSSLFIRFSTCPSMVLVAYRNVIAALLLLPLILTKYRREMASLDRKTVLVSMAAGIFLCLLVPAGGTPLFGYGSVNYLCAFMMAIVSSLLSHAVFTWSFKYISPTLVSLMKLSTPVWGALWAVLLFAEVPLWNQAVGGIIVTAGIVLYLRKKNKQ